MGLPSPNLRSAPTGGDMSIDLPNVDEKALEAFLVKMREKPEHDFMLIRGHLLMRPEPEVRAALAALDRIEQRNRPTGDSVPAEREPDAWIGPLSMDFRAKQCAIISQQRMWPEDVPVYFGTPPSSTPEPLREAVKDYLDRRTHTADGREWLCGVCRELEDQCACGLAPLRAALRSAPALPATSQETTWASSATEAEEDGSP
jgi:hypothetical protein